MSGRLGTAGRGQLATNPRPDPGQSLSLVTRGRLGAVQQGALGHARPRVSRVGARVGAGRPAVAFGRR